MPRLPLDEFAALNTVYRETHDAGQPLGSPGYGRPTALTTSLVNAGQVDLTYGADGQYRASLTNAGKQIVELERANQ